MCLLVEITLEETVLKAKTNHTWKRFYHLTESQQKVELLTKLIQGYLVVYDHIWKSVVTGRNYGGKRMVAKT